MIIAIDGPSGSGKNTISKILAQKLNLTYIDTGAIYRTLAFAARRENYSIEDGSSLGKVAKNFPISFKFINGVNHVYYNDEDVSEEIRSPEVSMNASKVSAHKEVRTALLNIQRELGKKGAVLEGRDIGTVVFPNAEYKFFLIASDDARAKRRMLELTAKGYNTTLEEVKKDMNKRDKQDSERAHAPLLKAKDAIEIDNSNLTIDGTVDLMLSYIEDK